MRRANLGRFIPNGAILREYPEVNAVVYVYADGVKYYAVAYSGKRNKYDFYYSFGTKTSLDNHIEGYINNLKRIKTWKEEQKAKRKAENSKGHSLVVGDIVVSSGGWEQTNVYAYSVVQVTKHTAKIQRIALQSVEGSEGFMSDNVVPVKDSFIGDEVETKRFDYRNYASGGWGTISKWDGRPKYRSWYA